MKRYSAFGVISVLLMPISSALGSSFTTPAQSGVTISTTIDTIVRQVIYGFDLTALPYEYEQIAFSPSPLKAFSEIPLIYGAVVSPWSTESNFHQIYDGQTFVGWSLEIQYMAGSAPPRINSVTINYAAGVRLSGHVIRLPGDDNVTVTYREPAEGFPDGQDDNIVLWAYVPEVMGLPGDFDGSGVVDTQDINPFVFALTDSSGYEAAYGVAARVYDLTGDVVINTEDINPFVAALTGAGAEAVIPEPSGLGLLAAAAVFVPVGRRCWTTRLRI